MKLNNQSLPYSLLEMGENTAYCINLDGRVCKVRIWRVFQTYKFRVGKDHRCLKRTYKSEENARSQSCQGLKADRIGSSSSL